MKTPEMEDKYRSMSSAEARPHPQRQQVLRDSRSSETAGPQRLQVLKDSRSSETSGPQRLQVLGDFRSSDSKSSKTAGPQRLQVLKDFRSSETSGPQRLQVLKDFRSSETSGPQRNSISGSSNFFSILKSCCSQRRSCGVCFLFAAVHCGYLVLCVSLWAELTAGMVLRTANPGMQSVIEDLQDALRKYNSDLTETEFQRNLQVAPCSDAATPPQQSSALIHQLTRYQKCAAQLAALCPAQDQLCKAVNLNNDLLLHLGSYQASADCPAPPSQATDSTVSQYLQCVHCWSQQVAALRT